MKAEKIQILDFEQPIAELSQQLDDMRKRSHQSEINIDAELETLQTRLEQTKQNVYQNLSAWQKVQICRHPQRPFMLDYIELCFENFVELHGDRRIGDDDAMPAGFATFNGIRCVVIGHQKGRDTKENLKRNFGSARPEGYRKALRLMRLAAKFSLPIITFIDTPGAFPGVEAEERNIAEAIARNLREMVLIPTPIIAIIIGEGGSGGALGIAVADHVSIMENAYYSVISPEGCAAILWKKRDRAADAADAIKLGASNLLELKVADEIIPEPLGGGHQNPMQAAAFLKVSLEEILPKLLNMPIDSLLAERYNKFRRMGVYAE